MSKIYDFSNYTVTFDVDTYLSNADILLLNNDSINDLIPTEHSRFPKKPSWQKDVRVRAAQREVTKYNQKSIQSTEFKKKLTSTKLLSITNKFPNSYYHVLSQDVVLVENKHYTNKKYDFNANLTLIKDGVQQGGFVPLKIWEKNPWENLEEKWRSSSYGILITRLNIQRGGLVPYYYFPTIENLQRDSLSIGKKAFQFLNLGQIKDSLNLAKLAVKINAKDEKLWLILSEAQVANKLYYDALKSLNNAEQINSNTSEIYFAKSNIYLKLSQLQSAKTALEESLKIEPNNHKAIFQLGNILLMEKNYFEAIKLFNKAIQIKPDFWQAINNKGLAYFEENNINSSIESFEKAISIEENAESLLGLATCLRIKNINEEVIQLAKKALAKDPNYVNTDYRKEQLWGEKLQRATELLLQNEQLKKDVILAKTKIN